MKKAKRLLCVLLALVMALTLLACGGNSGGTTEGGGSGPAKRDSVVTCINADLGTLDPQNMSAIVEQQVASSMYEQLIFIDTDKVMHPWLAESWELSDDATSVTFHIRKGVKFHNGEEMTVEDVVDSIERWKASPYQGDMLQGITSVEAPDDSTVVVTLGAPDAGIVTWLSSAIITDKSYYEEVGEENFSDAPIGTGPYKFVSYNIGDAVKLTRFDDYWGGAPEIKDVTYRVITDPNTAAVSLQTGDVDFTTVAAAALPNVQADPNLVVEEYEMSHITYLLVNTTKAPFDDIRVRQALNYAIDKQFIIDTCMDGLGTPAATMVPPQEFALHDKLTEQYPYDPDKAVELLADAGVTDLHITISTLSTWDTLAAVVQQQLKEVGITADVELVEQNRLFEELYSFNYDICTFGISLGGDPGIWAMVMGTGAGFNLSGMGNDEVDALFAQAAVTTDPDARNQIFLELFTKYGEDAVTVPLYYQKRFLGHNKDLVIEDINGGMPFIRDMRWN